MIRMHLIAAAALLIISATAEDLDPLTKIYDAYNEGPGFDHWME